MPAEGEFTLVFNCAGMAKYGQEKIIYEENIYGLSMTCAREAARRNVQRFVELSTAQVYSGDKVGSAFYARTEKKKKKKEEEEEEE